MSDETNQAVGAPLERQVRPQCWAFAMDFLGDPEAPEVEAYVANVEADARLLAAWLQWCLDNCDDSPEYNFGTNATEHMRALLACMPAPMPGA